MNHSLDQVVVPEVFPLLSSSRLLTMEYIDGVPLLDIASMDLSIKQELVSGLVSFNLERLIYIALRQESRLLDQSLQQSYLRASIPKQSVEWSDNLS